MSNCSIYKSAESIKQHILDYNPYFKFDSMQEFDIPTLLKMFEYSSSVDITKAIEEISDLIDERDYVSPIGDLIMQELSNLSNDNLYIVKDDNEYVIGKGVYQETGISIHVSKDSLSEILKGIDNRKHSFDKNLKVGELTIKWLGFNKEFYICTERTYIHVKNYIDFENKALQVINTEGK